MSGSLKDTIKAINARLSCDPDPALPLPDDLVKAVHAYLDKHEPREESDKQRLQEELFTTYHNLIEDNHSRLAPFLAILGLIRPGLRGSGRILQWWDKMSVPVLSNLGDQKGLVAEARAALLRTLAYDPDDGEKSIVDDDKNTSEIMAERLLGIWLVKAKASFEDLDMQARFMERQIRQILLAFGKKRPRDFLILLDKYFAAKASRISILPLLCEFVRHGPPHLDQVLQTPLFDHLLQCLQADTSTRVISLAITALVMILPHIPNSASKHLPALFNIYSRMLFWDRERKKSDHKAVRGEQDSDDEESDQLGGDKNSWDKMSYLLDNEDNTVPELLHYFTFLYGLYPINFMSYIRKPQRYLRHAKFPGADDLDVEPTEIRARSETFRKVHVLHPNFFMMTIENELTDSNRWMKSTAADVVAECMALYSPIEEPENISAESRPNGTSRIASSENPANPESDLATPFQSRHNSWRNTQSTVAHHADDHALHTKASQSSISDAESPISPSESRPSSPTVPSRMLTSPSHNQLHELLNSQKPAKGSIYQTVNDSAASLALSHHQDTAIKTNLHVDAYLASLTSREAMPRSRSPSLHPDSNLKVAYLQREIQLLRNDLNFERYLKHQHLSAIGQLRSRQIKQARGEAEIQNLINSNAIIKSKLEEAKNLNIQMRTETEKSKAHSRKWESELSAKLRILRDEQKKWIVEREERIKDLQLAKQRTEKLKNLVIESEARELASRQKVQSVESSLDELERLRAEVEILTVSLRTYEAGESEAVDAKESEEAALRQVEILKMQLLARDTEIVQSKQTFEGEIQKVKAEYENNKETERIRRQVIDEALAVSHHRIEQMQKVHDHLLKRFQATESQLMEHIEFRRKHEQREPHEEALLGGEAYASDDSMPPTNAILNPNAGKAQDGYGDQIESSFSARLNQHKYGISPSKQLDSTSREPHYTPHPYDASHPASGSPPASLPTVSTSSDDHSVDTQGNKKVKISPQSELRVHGRGGVQNVGKKIKPEKDHEHSDKTTSGKDGSDGKKDKKLANKAGVAAFSYRGFGGM
ncbi:hypothetical protein HYFRA_00004638 [Hymenoscyphus fraxineus]|uniref:Tuberous sclerosis 1 n=1 Tax=Hymenoscyphus fraxineus TaxID=746836 RepID=A0A9N9KUW2_9HELO|nr:hypothetical protein HYFRA_00004638 [Hymenoscyphus fraxineus]